MATLVCNSGSYTIVGAASTTARALSIASGSYVVTGTVIGTIHGYRLIAISGVYTLTGTLINTRRISAAPAGYILNGQTVNLVYAAPNKKVTAVSGSYTLTGPTTTKLEKAVKLVIGAYTLSGSTVNLVRSSSGNKITAVSGGYSLIGSTVGLLSTVSMTTGDYGVTGTVANLRKGKTVQAASGSYTVFAGPTVKLAQSRHFPVASGSYSITTADVTTLRYGSSHAKIFPADSGSYTLSGQPVTLLFLNRILTAVSGSYTVTGQRIRLPFYVSPGSYALTGQPVSLRRTVRLVATSGSYGVSGQVAILFKATYKLTATPGVYSISGLNTTIRAARFFVANTGLYGVNGPDIILRATHISVSPGSYALTGATVNLTSSHSGRWRKQSGRPASGTKQLSRPSNWDSQDTSPGVP